MTEKQKFKFYFPAWNRCARANNWIMKKGRLVAEEPSPDITLPERAQVWTYARQLAALEHRGITPNDFRHACHIVALKRDKSSAQLDTREVNRVVALFDLLADPHDLQARMNWENPENKERASLIARLKKLAPEAYIIHLTTDLWDTKAWQDLQQWQLVKLVRLLQTRKPAWNRPRPKTFTPRPATHKQPARQFPKLEYVIKKNDAPKTDHPF